MKVLVNVFGVLGLVYMVMISAHAQAPNLANMDIVERSIPDGPVAFVAGAPVSGDTFLELYRARLLELQLSRRAERMSAGRVPGKVITISDDERVRLGVVSFGELIQRELLLLDAQERGLSVASSELDSAYRQQIEAIQARRKLSGQPEISEAEILSGTGQTLDEVRERLGKGLLVKKAQQAIMAEANTKISDSDIEEFYEKRRALFHLPDGMHIRQISVRPRPSPEAASEEQWAIARERIKTARARIRAGERFDSVAREVSESLDRSKGGDLGMMPVGDDPNALPEFFVKAGDALQPGELSEIIRSEFGLHFIQLVAVQDGSDVSLEKARSRIEKMLLKRQESVVLDGYLQPRMSDNVQVFFQLEKILSGKASTERQD